MILYINFVLCFLFYSSSASPLVAGSYGDEQTLSTGGAYSWGQWKLTSSGTDGSLHLWSDVAALELRSGSNGWFNFLVDGKVSIMWSIGDYNSADRTSFLEGLQRARDSVAHKPLQPILTVPGPNKFVFGTWTLMSEKENELLIKNSDFNSQKTILRVDLAGFIFVPVDDNKEKLLKAETLLEDLPELATKEEQVDSPKEQCDTKRLSSGDVYSWGQWVLVPADGWLYTWSDAAAIKHSANSNGWFDFLLDGKESTMYSAGWVAEDSSDIVGRLQRLKSSIENTEPQAILSKPGCTKFVFGNWILSSKKEGDLLIHNSLEQDQTTTLRSGLSGFIFKSTNDEEKVLTAKSLIFGAGQSGKEQLQLTTTLAPLEITETYIPPNAHNPAEPCRTECAPRELAAADSGSPLHFGSLVGGELQRFPQRERLQIMVSILRVLREYSPKQGSACTADVEDSPVY